MLSSILHNFTFMIQKKKMWHTALQYVAINRECVWEFQQYRNIRKALKVYNKTFYTFWCEKGTEREVRNKKVEWVKVVPGNIIFKTCRTSQYNIKQCVTNAEKI